MQLTLEQIDAELARRGVGVTEAEPAGLSLEQIDAELARRGIEVPEYTAGQRALQPVYGAADTYGSLADLLTVPQSYQDTFRYGQEIRERIANRNPATRITDTKHYDTLGAAKPASIRKHLTEGVNKIAGKDLAPKEGDVVGHALTGAGRWLMPGKAATVAKNALLGATSGIAQAFGAPAIAADLGVAIGAPTIANITKRLLSDAPVLSAAEKKVGQYLGGLSEEAPEVVAERLRSHQSPIEGYKPATAEIAEVPAVAQIHRAQQGVIGTGIAEHADKGTEVLHSALEKVTPEAKTHAPGRLIQEELHKELKSRKKVRHEASNPYYQKIKKNKDELIPSNLKKVMNDEIVEGDLKADLDFVKGMVGKRKPLKSAEQALEQYNNMKPFFQRQLPKPDGLSVNPEVRRLSAAVKAINARIKKYSAPMASESNDRIGRLVEYRNALNKDLEHIPEHVQANALYREFSPSVNKINRNPGLRPVVQKKHGEFVMPHFSARNAFVNNAETGVENTRALRAELGQEGNVTDELRRLRIEQLHKAITNKGAISPHKMSQYMEGHNGQAIKELLTEDQLKVINGIDEILKGRHYAASEGAATNSHTSANLRNALDFTGGMNKFLTRHTLKEAGTKAGLPGLAGKTIEAIWDIGSHLYKQGTEKALNRSLLDPEYAAMLMSNPLQSQSAAEKFINYFGKSAPLARHTQKHEEK